MIRASVAVFVMMITVCVPYNTTSAQGAAQYGLDTSELRCDEAERPGKDKMITTTAITLPADYLQAILVALEDFKRKIKRENHGHNDALGLFLADFKNYEIKVTHKTQKESYRLSFNSKMFQGEHLKGGGGAEYIVDGQTYKILKKEYYM